LEKNASEKCEVGEKFKGEFPDLRLRRCVFLTRFFTDLMKGAANDFVAVIEGRPPSEEEHRNSERFLREVGLLSKELRGINSTRASPPRKRRRTDVQPADGPPAARVVVSIDEAHVLSERPLPPNARTSFYVFAHVLSHIKDYPIAFTAMSTM
jgi:hypothetical protein